MTSATLWLILLLAASTVVLAWGWGRQGRRIIRIRACEPLGVAAARAEPGGAGG